MYLAFAEAMLGQFEFDGWVVKGGELVVHGLHDFEALKSSHLCCGPPSVAPRVEGVGGCVERGFLLNLVDAPGSMVEL